MRAQSLCSLLFVTEAPSKVQLRSQLPWEGFAICSIDEATAIILFLLIYRLIVNCLVAYLSAIIKVWLSHLFNSRLWSIWLYCELWRAKTSPSMVSNSARWQSSKDRLSCMVVTVVQPLSCVRLCDPMDCSTPGFPVLHRLLEFAQTHIHWVGDFVWRH